MSFARSYVTGRNQRPQTISQTNSFKISVWRARAWLEGRTLPQISCRSSAEVSAGAAVGTAGYHVLEGRCSAA